MDRYVNRYVLFDASRVEWSCTVIWARFQEFLFFGVNVALCLVLPGLAFEDHCLLI